MRSTGSHSGVLVDVTYNYGAIVTRAKGVWSVNLHPDCTKNSPTTGVWHLGSSKGPTSKSDRKLEYNPWHRSPLKCWLAHIHNMLLYKCTVSRRWELRRSASAEEEAIFRSRTYSFIGSWDKACFVSLAAWGYIPPLDAKLFRSAIWSHLQGSIKMIWSIDGRVSMASSEWADITRRRDA